MKLFIGADHRGKELENYLFQSLKEAGNLEIEISSFFLPFNTISNNPDERPS